jgi:hypothetical protein
VFLVRISKIYTSGIRIRTNQSRFAIRTPFECFSHHGSSVYHNFLKNKLKLVRVLSCKKNAGRIVLRQVYLTGHPFRGLNGPGIFTVRTPRARTHQRQLAGMHERTGMHEPAYMMLLLLQPAAVAATNGSSKQQQQNPAVAPAATARFLIRGTYSCIYRPTGVAN